MTVIEVLTAATLVISLVEYGLVRYRAATKSDRARKRVDEIRGYSKLAFEATETMKHELPALKKLEGKALSGAALLKYLEILNSIMKKSGNGELTAAEEDYAEELAAAHAKAEKAARYRKTGTTPERPRR